ncbi:MAG: tetratricopeptide repeat protein, partial [Chloroflexia bacterium]
ALATVQRWVESDPGNPLAHERLAGLFVRQKELRLALREIRTAARLKPEEVRYLRQAAALCRQLQWFDEAYETLKSALERAPNDAANYVELGRLFQEQGKVENALRHYEQAISLNPRDAEAYYHAGVLYRRQKDYDRAIEYLRQATRLRPGYSEALVELAKVTTLAFMTRRLRPAR